MLSSNTKETKNVYFDSIRGSVIIGFRPASSQHGFGVLLGSLVLIHFLYFLFGFSPLLSAGEELAVSFRFFLHELINGLF